MKNYIIKCDDFNRLKITDKDLGLNGFFIFQENHGIFKGWQSFNSMHFTNKEAKELLKYLKDRYKDETE